MTDWPARQRASLLASLASWVWLSTGPLFGEWSVAAGSVLQMA